MMPSPPILPQVPYLPQMPSPRGMMQVTLAGHIVAALLPQWSGKTEDDLVETAMRIADKILALSKL